MNQYNPKESEVLYQKIGHVIVLCSLLFSVCALNFSPLGSTLRYYMDILAGFSLIYLLLFRNEIDWGVFGKSLVHCCTPFLPFLCVYVVIRTYHGIYWTDDGIFFRQFVLLVITSSVFFGVITQNTRISKRLFFGCCAVAAVVYFVAVILTAYLHSAPLWSVKPYMHPVGTTYARCISLTSGLSLLGFFLLPSSEKKLRLGCLLAAILGFCSAIWFIGIRSVVLVPLFALIVGYAASPLKIRTKVLTLILFGILAAIVVAQSPMVAKMQRAYSEASNVISYDAVNVTLSNFDKKEQTPQEAKIQKYLNTSVGARLAVWGIAQRALKNHLWLGTGKGRPQNFVNTKKLFKFSHDYLKHFHSDYVQITIVGGIVLLVSFLLTQLWLFIRSIRNRDPIGLFMILSMVSYGLFDYGFFDRRVLVCYVGASLIIWSWHYPKKGEQSSNDG